MEIFRLKVRSEPHSGRLIATCEDEDTLKDSLPVLRSFADETELIQALSRAGISAVRYQPALDAVRWGSAAYFEISLNECEKLDVMRIDSTE
jgi:hypothetical protein